MLGIVEERQEASHSSFNYPKGHAKRMNRPMVIRTNEKEMPLLHIHNNLKTLDLQKSKSDFEKWLKEKK